jgi:hypothetical protein
MGKFTPIGPASAQPTQAKPGSSAAKSTQPIQAPAPVSAQASSTAPAPPTAPPLTHLHFGGSTSRSGALGAKPQQGRQFRVQKRIETIVRLENAGFTPQQIAPMLSISIPRVKMLMKSADYLNARIKITHGIIVDYAGSLAEIKSQRREMLTQQLPAAFQVLVNELMSSGVTLAERKHKAAIAQDLLDREGSLAKISRAEVKPVDAFDFEKADAASNELISVVRGSAPAPQNTNAHTGEGAHSSAALAANLEFANSKTLSAVDQQTALELLEREANNLSAAVLESMLADKDRRGEE